MSQKIFTHSEANEIFKFRCNVKWQELYTDEPTANTRYCGSCGRSVHLCLNEQDVLEHAKLGNCIAIAAEIPNDKRLEYSTSHVETGEPAFVHGDVYFERDDGLKLFAFHLYVDSSHTAWKAPAEFYYIYNVWQSSNDVIRKVLLDLESHPYCRNQYVIYDLKALLAWIDEAIAYGSTWRLYCDDLSNNDKVMADHKILTNQQTALVELLLDEELTLSYQLRDDMNANAITVGRYKIIEAGRYHGCQENDINSPIDVTVQVCDNHRLEVRIKANRFSTQKSVIQLPIPYIDPTIRGRFVTYPTIAFTVHILNSVG